jgi:hypothetical protein
LYNLGVYIIIAIRIIMIIVILSKVAKHLLYRLTFKKPMFTVSSLIQN